MIMAMVMFVYSFILNFKWTQWCTYILHGHIIDFFRLYINSIFNTITLCNKHILTSCSHWVFLLLHSVPHCITRERTEHIVSTNVWVGKGTGYRRQIFWKMRQTAMTDISIFVNLNIFYFFLYLQTVLLVHLLFHNPNPFMVDPDCHMTPPWYIFTIIYDIYKTRDGVCIKSQDLIYNYIEETSHRYF